MASLFGREAPSPRHKHDARYTNVASLTEIFGNCLEFYFRQEASTSNPPVKLQVLLRREWRTSSGIEEARGILVSAGLKPTASGMATISVETEPERFESLFGVTASEIAPRAPSGTDFGKSGGYVSAELAVPKQLLKYVQSISIAPPHILLEH
jgi:hypothetical protein